MLVLGAGAGLSPRRARYFSLLRQRKGPKRKATPSLRPLRCAKGQTCVESVAGCAVELALRCARRSDSHGESVHEAWALRRPCQPATAPPQAQPAGGGQPNIQTTEQPNNRTTEQPNNRTTGHPFGPLLRSAAPAQREALAPARWGRAQRWPVWMFCPQCPSGCAEERRVWRIRARVCLSDAQRRELSETPPNPSTAGCPGAQRRGRRQWGRFLFGDFLLARQEKVTRLPGDSRPPPSKKACHSMRTRPQDSAGTPDA